MPDRHDAERLRRHARWLDSQYGIPFTPWRWGLESIIGLVPGVGDTVGAVLSLWIPFEAWKLGARPGLVLRMLLNVAIDAVIGSIPVLGDVFDVMFRANERNVALFERAVGAAGGDDGASGAA